MTTSVSEVTRLVYSGLEQNGYRGRIVSIKHIADLKEEIEAHYNEGVLDETLYREYCLASFESGIPEDFPTAKSLIIIAAPQPQYRVKFNFRGGLFRLTIPPQYSHKTDETVENLLSDILKPKGFNLRTASLPNKLLAVRSGLAKYGKNNISYIESLGSFYKLRTFFSDLPAIEDRWHGLQLLEQCNKCRACINKCPTGAIVEHRFLIQAEKCLTFHNERKGEFPDWIEPSWHNCLIGCMRCQSVCPADKRLFNWFEEKESFTEEETELILKGTSRYQLPRTTIGKLQRLYLLDDIDVMPRNLNALIKQCEGR
ncbi:Epoxyqueuosine reductase [subsurface metagenome]|nr:FeS-binding protein [Dehalococcoidia bacterium]